MKNNHFEHIIIIPCYNESNRINIALFESFLKSNFNYLLIFANDGSLDKTSEKVLPLQTKYSNCEIFDFPKNEGKANTIRKWPGVISNGCECNWNLNFQSLPNSKYSLSLNNDSYIFNSISGNE